MAKTPVSLDGILKTLRIKKDIGPEVRSYENLVGTINIITYGRSGSTLLQSILQTIPGSCIRGENLGALFPIYESYLRLEKAKLKFGKSHLSTSKGPWYGIDEVDLEKYAKASIGIFIDNVIRPPSNVRWIGFKEIRYDVIGNELEGYVNFMGKFFPNPYFVFNTRDVKSVRKSGWWARQDEITVTKNIEEMDSKFSAYMELNPDRTFHAKYEKTVENPESLRPFFELIGERLDLTKIRSVLATKLTH